MADEMNASELSARPLDRETMRALLRKVRERAAAAADEGAAKRDASIAEGVVKRDASIAAEKKKTADRVAELRRQGEELLAGEGKPEP